MRFQSPEEFLEYAARKHTKNLTTLAVFRNTRDTEIMCFVAGEQVNTRDILNEWPFIRFGFRLEFNTQTTAGDTALFAITNHAWNWCVRNNNWMEGAHEVNG